MNGGVACVSGFVLATTILSLIITISGSVYQHEGQNMIPCTKRPRDSDTETTYGSKNGLNYRACYRTRFRNNICKILSNTGDLQPIHATLIPGAATIYHIMTPTESRAAVYPDNMLCTYSLPPRKFNHLYFYEYDTQLEIEESSSQFRCLDSLQYNHTLAGLSRNQILCGHVTPKSEYVMSDTISLTFRSNNIVQQTGAEFLIIEEFIQGKRFSGNLGDQGPAGFKGGRGRPGPRGNAGRQGAQGTRGIRGHTGESGPLGPPGVPGTVGSPGRKGARGPKGIKGTPGPSGITTCSCSGPIKGSICQSSKGDPGLSGDIGMKGRPGVDGLPGRSGAPGASGIDGLPGLPGSPGIRGSPGSRGNPGLPGSVGLPGAPGLPGPSHCPGITKRDIEHLSNLLSSNILVSKDFFDAWRGKYSTNQYNSFNVRHYSQQSEQQDIYNFTEHLVDKNQFQIRRGTVLSVWTDHSKKQIIDKYHSKPFNEQRMRRTADLEGLLPRSSVCPKGALGPRGLPGDFGEHGRQGDRGPPGYPGLHGVQGSRGLPGEIGDKGYPGFSGHPGSNGPPGLPGLQGSQGPRGPPGRCITRQRPTGVPGLPGPRGPPGTRGIRQAGTPGEPGLPGNPSNRRKGQKGDKGERGPPGYTGLRGTPGPTGFTGRNGINGPKGRKGDPGADGLDGPKGLPGLQGKPGPTGPRGPSGPPGCVCQVFEFLLDEFNYVIPADGIANETAIDTETKMILPGLPGPVANSYCVQGSTGSPGYPGEKGEQGYKGDRGVPGPNGIKGINGPVGVKGSKGDQGLQGLQGPIGSNGLVGDKGLPGDEGNIGPPGRDKICDRSSRSTRAASCPPGSKGIKGAKGVRGYPGRPGFPGPKGFPGVPGPPGVEGPKGQRGLPGHRGSRGRTGSRGVPGPRGPPGLPGPIGSTDGCPEFDGIDLSLMQPNPVESDAITRLIIEKESDYACSLLDASQPLLQQLAVHYCANP